MSGAVIQISRGAFMALSASAGSLYLYTHGMLPPGLIPKDLSQLGLRLPNVPNPPPPDYLGPLSQQLSDLSSEVARLRVQSQYQGYYFQGGWGVSWTTVTTVGGVGVLYLYLRGYSFADFMYVTKKALSVAVEALEQGIETLGVALETAKRELSYKMGLIEDKLDDTKTSLENKISKEVGEVKNDLQVVGNDVKGISRAQEQVHGMVQGIEDKIISMENNMENANNQLSTANRGIYLLCNVVADNMVGAKGNNAQDRPSGQSLYEELMAYTRSAMNSFSRPFNQPQQQQQQQTPLLRSSQSIDGSQRSLMVEDLVGHVGSFSLSNNAFTDGESARKRM